MEFEDKTNAPEKRRDLLMVTGPTEDGQGLRALRKRPDRLEVSELRPIQESRPLTDKSEIVSLFRRAESPIFWDVETAYSTKENDDKPNDTVGAPSHAGPPRFTNAAYRRNWGKVFN